MKKKLSIITLCFVLALSFAAGTFAQDAEENFEEEIFEEVFEEEIFEEEEEVFEEFEVFEPEEEEVQNEFAILTAYDVTSDVYNVDDTALIIRGIAKNTTVADFLANLSITDADDPVVKSGTTVVTGSTVLKTGDTLTVTDGSTTSTYTIKTDLLAEYEYANETFDTSIGSNWASGSGVLSTASETVDGVTRKYLEIDMGTSTVKLQKNITNSRAGNMYVTEYEIWIPKTDVYPMSKNLRIYEQNSSSKYLATLRRDNSKQKALIMNSTETGGSWSKEGTIPLGEWAKIKIVTDNVAHTYSVTVNGEPTFQHPKNGTYNLPYQATSNFKPTKFFFEFTKTTGLVLKFDNFRMYEPATLAVSKASFTTGEVTSLDVNNVYNKVGKISVKFAAPEGAAVNESTLSNVKLYNASNEVVTTSNPSYDATTMTYTFDVSEELVAGQRYTIKFAGVTDSANGLSMTDTVGFNTIATPAPTYSLTSAEYTVDDTNLKITGVVPGTTFTEFMDNLTITGGTPVIKDADGNDISDTDIVKDGTTITLKDSLNTSVYVVELNFAQDLVFATGYEFISQQHVNTNASAVYSKVSSIKVYLDTLSTVGLDVSSLGNVTLEDSLGGTVAVTPVGYDETTKAYTVNINASEPLTVGGTYTLKLVDVKDTVFEKPYTLTKTFTVIDTPAPDFKVETDEYNIYKDEKKVVGVKNGSTIAEFKTNFVLDGAEIKVIRDKDGNDLTDADTLASGYQLVLSDGIQEIVYEIVTDITDDYYYIYEDFDTSIGTWKSGGSALSLKTETDGQTTRTYLSIDLTDSSNKVVMETPKANRPEADMFVAEFDAWVPTNDVYAKKIHFQTMTKDSSNALFATLRRENAKGNVFRALGTGWSDNATVALGAWHNYRMVVNYKDRTFRIYIDGELIIKQGSLYDIAYQAPLNKLLQIFQVEWTAQTAAAEIKLDNLRIYEPNPITVAKLTFETGSAKKADIDVVANVVDKVNVHLSSVPGISIVESTVTDIKLFDSQDNEIATEGAYNSQTGVYTFTLKEVLRQNETYRVKIDGIKDSKFNKTLKAEIVFKSKDADIKAQDGTVSVNGASKTITLAPQIKNTTDSTMTDVNIIAVAVNAQGDIIASKVYNVTEVSGGETITPTITMTTLTTEKANEVTAVNVYIEQNGAAPLAETFVVNK